MKVTGFGTDTYKEPAEKTLNEMCASAEGFVEAFMPGQRNDVAFIKFVSAVSQRRFMNKCHNGEIVVQHAGNTLTLKNTRTFEQKQRTKHIDKLKRAILEAIQAAHTTVKNGDSKGKVESGMVDGGVVWIGDVWIAQIPKTPGQYGRGDVKDFRVDADKITNEAKAYGWIIDGADVLKSYNNVMEE